MEKSQCPRLPLLRMCGETGGWMPLTLASLLIIQLFFANFILLGQTMLQFSLNVRFVPLLHPLITSTCTNADDLKNFRTNFFTNRLRLPHSIA